jgi:hypothetical protein
MNAQDLSFTAMTRGKNKGDIIFFAVKSLDSMTKAIGDYF